MVEFAPRVAHVHDGQNLRDADLLADRLARRSLFRLFHLLGYAPGLLLLFVVVERLAVFLNLAVDLMAVDKEDLVFLAFGFLHLPVAVDVLDCLR